jgi:hypothetical protein
LSDRRQYGEVHMWTAPGAVAEVVEKGVA